MPFTRFKIQYGEIYSDTTSIIYFLVIIFKIQYGEIYSKRPTAVCKITADLKSSMERFIVLVSIWDSHKTKI